MRFSSKEYRNGTCGLEGIGENDLFCQLFLQWKSIVPMSSDIRNQAIKRITVLLEKRTAGIMDANRRNYYGECAAYIAALGEVWESMGEPGVKQRLMTSYKDAYPRRSAFREEMRKYGWVDMKRNRSNIFNKEIRMRSTEELEKRKIARYCISKGLMV